MTVDELMKELDGKFSKGADVLAAKNLFWKNKKKGDLYLVLAGHVSPYTITVSGH